MTCKYCEYYQLCKQMMEINKKMNRHDEVERIKRLMVNQNVQDECTEFIESEDGPWDDTAYFIEKGMLIDELREQSRLYKDDEVRMGVLKACCDIIEHQPAFQIISDVDFDDYLKSIEIDSLNLKVKTFNCLKRAGINTLRDLCRMTYSEIKEIPHLTQTGFEEIQKAINEHTAKFIQNDEKTQNIEKPMNEEEITKLMKKGNYTKEEVVNGYVVCAVYNSDIIIEGAEIVECIDELVNEHDYGFKDDFGACRQAEKDGVKFINDIDGLEKGCYIDTPKNREICTEALKKYPEFRVENWLFKSTCLEIYRNLYIKTFGNPLD